MMKWIKIFLFDIRRIPLICLFFFSGASSVYAFEGFEHKHLGDRAVEIAIRYFVFTHFKNSESIPDNKEICNKYYPKLKNIIPFCGASGKDVLTYGDIAKVVDFLDYPWKIYEAYTPSHLYSPDSIKQISQSAITEAHREQSILLAKASSNNDAHFQSGLVNHILHLHRSAINEALKGRLYSAMVENALSDHYLHDFFAPGHITTSRVNSHDNVALGMHDTVNELGATFVIDQSNWKELKNILDFVEQYYDDATICSADLFIDVETESAECIPTVIDDINASHDQITLYGDNLLKEHRKQQLLMLLIEAQSILDILKACESINSNKNGECDRGTKEEADKAAQNRDADSKSVELEERNTQQNYNSLSWIKWQGSYDKDKKKVVPPVAEAPFGKYEVDEGLMSEASSILMLAIGGEASVARDVSAKLWLNVEYVPIKWIGATEGFLNTFIHRPVMHCDFFSLCNTSPAFGLVHLADEHDNYRASGYSLRYIKAIPAIDMQASVYVHRLWFDGKIDTIENNYGLRLDLGFSVVSLFIAVGKGSIVDDHIDIERDLTYTFGIGFGTPYTRVKRFFNQYGTEELEDW